MSDTLLQSTLRELRQLLIRPRLWLVFALVVWLFVVTGPFGTYDRLAFPTRLGYWLMLHAATWGCALISIAFFDAALRSLISSRLYRMLIGAIVSALPVGLAITVINFALLMRPLNAVQIAENALTALPIGLAFSLLTWLSLSGGDQMAADAISNGRDDAGETSPQASALAAEMPEVSPAQRTAEKPVNRPALLDRLPVEKRGILIRLEVQDHYVLVVTSRGTQLLLMRLGDAIVEAGPGQQVHRSHWVAEHEDNTLIRANGKNVRLCVRAANGFEVPVSRTFAARVQHWIGQHADG